MPESSNQTQASAARPVVHVAPSTRPVSTQDNGPWENLNASTDQVAVLNQEGTVVFVNDAWRRFAKMATGKDGANGLGSNYLLVCDKSRGDGADDARLVAAAIRDIIYGRRQSFRLDYPCRSATTEDWYSVNVNRSWDYEQTYVVVSHRQKLN